MTSKPSPRPPYGKKKSVGKNTMSPTGSKFKSSGLDVRHKSKDGLQKNKPKYRQPYSKKKSVPGSVMTTTGPKRDKYGKFINREPYGEPQKIGLLARIMKGIRGNASTKKNK